ncbi:MAG: hypothetical protein ACRBBQ_02815 [Cognatishimia sp.]
MATLVQNSTRASGLFGLRRFFQLFTAAVDQNTCPHWVEYLNNSSKS